MKIALVSLFLQTLFIPFIFSQTKKQPAKKSQATSTSNSAKPKVEVKKTVKIPAKTSPSTTAKTKINSDKVKTKIAPTPLPQKVKTAEEIAMTSREQEMVNEINALRSDPASFVLYVEDYFKKFGKTDEDLAFASREVITLLKKMKPLAKLTFNSTLYSAAKHHGLYLLKEDAFEHSSLPYFENLSLGHKDVREAVVDLLIDAGISDRGHRKNFLNEQIRQVGIYEVLGKVHNFRYCYVMEFK